MSVKAPRKAAADRLGRSLSPLRSSSSSIVSPTSSPSAVDAAVTLLRLRPRILLPDAQPRPSSRAHPPTVVPDDGAKHRIARCRHCLPPGRRGPVALGADPTEMCPCDEPNPSSHLRPGIKPIVRGFHGFPPPEASDPVPIRWGRTGPDDTRQIPRAAMLSAGSTRRDVECGRRVWRQFTQVLIQC